MTKLPQVPGATGNFLSKQAAQTRQLRTMSQAQTMRQSAEALETKRISDKLLARLAGRK